MNPTASRFGLIRLLDGSGILQCNFPNVIGKMKGVVYNN